MSYALSAVKEHLIGMGHGGTLNKVRNQEALFERAANNVLAKLDPDETIRSTTLVQSDPDDDERYELPSDFKKLIDLRPTADRASSEDTRRLLMRPFDLQKAFATRLISIEAEDGTKFLRSNYEWATAKYYSQYLFKAANVWVARPADDDSLLMLHADALNIYLYECLIEMAQQMEGTDSAFDITYATRKLHGDPTAVDDIGKAGLYRLYLAEHPTQTKKAAARYGSGPRLKR